MEICERAGFLLPYGFPPRCLFPIKSLALSAHVSPRTIHFRALDKSPVLGPGRGPPSCNKWRLGQGLFFAETDILTTLGTQGPACLPMDQTQRPQLGPFCPWSPADADNWPECPTSKEQETLLTSLPFPLSFLSLTLPILLRFSSLPVLDAGIWSKGPQPELRLGD